MTDGELTQYQHEVAELAHSFMRWDPDDTINESRRKIVVRKLQACEREMADMLKRGV